MSLLVPSKRCHAMRRPHWDHTCYYCGDYERTCSIPVGYYNKLVVVDFVPEWQMAAVHRKIVGIVVDFECFR